MKKLFGVALLFIQSVLSAQSGHKPLNPDEYMRMQDSVRQAMTGKPYPAFNYKADDGITYSNESLLGKKYYINFWFEGCHPCMEEMNSLIALNNSLKGTGNEFISFTFEKPKDIKRIKQERGINFKVISIEHEECYRLNLNSGFPAHIVVDEKGNIEYVGMPFMSNEMEIKKVYELLKGK